MNPCLESLRKSFDAAGAQYEVIEHPSTFAAQRVAATEHVAGHEFAKSVVVMADGQPRLLVLPAPHVVDIEAVRGRLNAGQVRLAREDEFKDLFPDCEVGAMPPFPGANNLPVYVEHELLEEPEIVFEAGSHTESVRMKTDDYLRLAAPEVISFGREPKTAPPAVTVEEEADVGWLFGAIAAALGVGATLLLGRVLLGKLMSGKKGALISGAALGGVAVALTDQRSGRRRRAMVRDKGMRYGRLGLRRSRGIAMRLMGRAKGAEHKVEKIIASKNE